MAEKTISKEIIKISRNVDITGVESGSSTKYVDTTFRFTEISSTTAIPISIMMRRADPSSSLYYVYYNLPYCTTNSIVTCYVYTWNVNTHDLVIRNLGSAWNNYEMTVIFLQ